MIKANYTVVLNTLLNDEVCKEEILKKGLGTYPLYETDSTDEKVKTLIPTREKLNKKILDFYKYHEIGFETVGRFIDELSIAMNEIMPYYNQRLRSVDMMNSIDDIFGNVDVEETTTELSKGSSQGKTTSNETSNNNSQTTTDTNDSNQTSNTMSDTAKTVKSDTPQNSLTVPAENIESVNYANEVQWNKNNSSSNGTAQGEAHSQSQTENESLSQTVSEGETDTTTERTLTYRKKGNQGVNTYAHDIIEFRQTIINIEQEIINDKRLRECFMLVY